MLCIEEWLNVLWVGNLVCAWWGKIKRNLVKWLLLILHVSLAVARVCDHMTSNCEAKLSVGRN